MVDAVAEIVLMGVYCHYQALPAESRLLARLQTEPNTYQCYADSLHEPRGPFDYGSEPNIDPIWADLRGELMSANAIHPGLPLRTAYHKLQDRFDAQLVIELTKLGHPEPLCYADRLIMGDQPLAPELFQDSASALQLIPVALVRDAAGWLRSISPESFDDLAADFRSWQRLFAEAASRGEVIIIG